MRTREKRRRTNINHEFVTRRQPYNGTHALVCLCPRHRGIYEEIQIDKTGDDQPLSLTLDIPFQTTGDIRKEEKKKIKVGQQKKKRVETGNSIDRASLVPTLKFQKNPINNERKSLFKKKQKSFGLFFFLNTKCRDSLLFCLFHPCRAYKL
jgi:hypothetical protein